MKLEIVIEYTSRDRQDKGECNSHVPDTPNEQILTSFCVYFRPFGLLVFGNKTRQMKLKTFLLHLSLEEAAVVSLRGRHGTIS